MTVVGPHSILLDAEALTLLAADSHRMKHWLAFAIRTDSVLYASTVTLAETTDGSTRDARLRRTVKMIRLLPATDAIGYQAGALRSRASISRRKLRDLTVDAIVAATALTLPRPALLLTSDSDDLRLLLDGTGVRVEALT